MGTYYIKYAHIPVNARDTPVIKVGIDQKDAGTHENMYIT